MKFEDYDALYDEARDEWPFSDSFEHSEFAARNCGTCIYDQEQHGDKVTGPGCPLLTIAMVGRTPIQWFETEPGSREPYRCIEYRHKDDGPGPEPQPIPDPPGQLVLAPREEFEGVRMFADVARSVRPEAVTR